MSPAIFILDLVTDLQGTVILMHFYEHYNHFIPNSLTLLSVIACDMLSSRDAREDQEESTDRELLNNSSTLDLQVWQTSVGLNLHKGAGACVK